MGDVDFVGVDACAQSPDRSEQGYRADHVYEGGPRRARRTPLPGGCLPGAADRTAEQ
ncbi:hypothetical protein [Streptomyces sp. SLBN-8D4]|uniref:hypothetical protein n=1 Tax=Streptomyces sp. SLBN-8D4 TaxID=3377728 RepID=UPI003C7EBE8C